MWMNLCLATCDPAKIGLSSIYIRNGGRYLSNGYCGSGRIDHTCGWEIPTCIDPGAVDAPEVCAEACNVTEWFVDGVKT